MFLFLSLVFSPLWSQDDFETLGESELAINHDVNDSYQINVSLRSRYFFYRNNTFNYQQQQIDLTHFSTFKINYYSSVSLGIQYRNRALFIDNGNELRITQQYNFTKRPFVLRFGHRFRLEQRIFEQLTILRGRYRFSVDFPLSGVKLDVGEAYLVFSTEALLSVNRSIAPEIDHRTTSFIGWLVSDSLKLQLGLEYRLEEFNLDPKSKFFIYTAAILKI